MTFLKEMEDDLVIERKGGGSIIERCPIFSLDTELLFVVWGSNIRAYGVRTGELVSEYEGLESKAVGIQLHPTNPNAIVACSEKGEYIQWDWRSRLSNSTVNLKLEKKSIVRGFHLLLPISEEDKRNRLCVLWKKKKEKGSMHTSLFCPKTGDLLLKVKITLNDDPHSIAFGGPLGREYMAGIHKYKLHVADTMKWSRRDRKIDPSRTFTCVACHPEEHVVATGDNTGRILIWYNLFTSENSVYTVYHWHTLPVQTVTFSQAGSQFFSGGGEHVLVKWTLDSSHRAFLPRLPAPICHSVMGSDNKYLALSTADNGIQIVDTQMRFISVIQHLTWSVEAKHGLKLFPAGINFDSRTKALVLNGRTGHIQFYSPFNKSLLYNIDITGLNYLTQERNEVIVNTDVVKVSLTSNGQWLATVEERDDGETNIEARLKFWNYDDVKQTYCLNTSVELPHTGKVLALAFQPSSDSQQQLAVTAGSDLKYRTWGLVESSNIYKKGLMVWKCESVGFFRNLPIGDISFALDGSLLAVTFGPTLTVWIPESNELKCSLTESEPQTNLSHVEFGLVDCSHLVVTGSPSFLNVWNLLTLTLNWKVPLEVSLMTSDPCSEYMAVFTKGNDLFVFTPRNSEPKYHKEAISKDYSILCAAFIPHSGAQITFHCSWQEHSQLYFLDSNQELLTLEKPGEDVTEKGGLILPISTHQTNTLFSSLQAKQSTSDVEKLRVDTEEQLGDRGAAAIRELLRAPAHTLPPMHLLCGPFLRSLLQYNPKVNEEETKENKNDSKKTETDSSEESEDETEVTNNIEPSIPEVYVPPSIEEIEARLEAIVLNKDWTDTIFEDE